MRARRSTAVASALLCAALAAAGCGLGPGEELGGATLTVTRDYGDGAVAGPLVEPVSESDTVMRVLDRNAEITTRYGGRFVQSIEGLEREDSGGRSLDWLFYVNGVESSVGAADFELRGGEAIWWDYRDWGAALSVPAVVGSWPHPFVEGYEGRDRPVAVECLGAGPACDTVRRRLEAEGVDPLPAGDRGAIRVLVGPWSRLAADPTAATIAAGPAESGVFVEIERGRDGVVIRGLDEAGEPARALGPRAGLVAATRRYGAPPVWVVTGAGPGGALAAARRLLDADSLRNRYAVAVEGGEETPLPLR